MSAIVTQFGLGSAFLLGLYDGTFTFKQLAECGDFGHGTFNAIDGEMVALEGQFYRINAEGKATLVNQDVQTPIATVTKFKAETVVHLNNVKNYASFQEKINKYLSSRNIIYAIRVDGTFKSLLARSLLPQPKPYEPLEISIPKTQCKFTLNDTKGTLVGYFVPDVFRHMVLSGFHFHYINETRDKGGHVFDFSFSEATVLIQPCRELRVMLPDLIEFDNMDLNRDFKHALQVAEKGHGH